MATQAHCAYCFECLAANFERRRPLSLAQVEESWERYHASKSDAQKINEAADSKGGAAEDDAEMTDAETEETSTARPAPISRLLNRETSATSSSSSLPSTTSNKSQKEASGSSTPASVGSSHSSINSLARGRRSTGEEYPLFVTWNTVSRSDRGKTLRGCIGTFEAQEIEYGLRTYALTSAFEDVRFQPIPASLLPRLSNHVTLLTNFSEPTRDPLDWTLGTHGIRISFTYHSRRYGATYLPDVAMEQGWTQDETLASLMRKAGWSGSGSWLKVWKDGKGELVRYEGKQVGLGFDEWKLWRDWLVSAGVKSESELRSQY